MLDVAALDNSLYNRLEAAYDSAVNRRHVRESLIRFIESGEERYKEFFRCFPEYGLRELTRVLADLDQLYRNCTGTELKSFRVC